MDNLYSHLSPKDDEVASKVQSDLDEAKQRAAKLNVVVFASKPEEDNKEGDKANGDQKSNAPVILPTNQKLQLLSALLREGSWNFAKQMLDHLSPSYAMSDRNVSSEMAKYLGVLIKPILGSSCSIPSQLQAELKEFTVVKEKMLKFTALDESLICHSMEDMLTKGFFSTLYYIGPYLSRDSVLMIRLLRIFQTFMSTFNPTTMNPDSWQAKFYFAMVTGFDDVILPSLSLMPSNCVVSENIWQVLKLMPYLHRYSLYGSWINDGYYNITPLINMRVHVTEKCRYSVKRVTKDNFKQIGRQLGKLSHANPGPVSDHLISTIQRYDNLIGPLIDALRYMTHLSFDVITYCVMKTLAVLASDQNEGAAALCSFTGQFVRRYNTEIAGLLQLVTNQLKVGTCEVDLALLREIVQKMSGIEPFEDATVDQLESSMGGDLLKAENGNLSNWKQLRKPAQRLRDSLCDASLATPVFILVAKHRPTVTYKSPIRTHLKVLGKMFDECQDTLLQYGTFLSNILTTNEYANSVPSLVDLLGEYRVPPDSSFFMARPILAGKIGEQTKLLTKQLTNQATKEGSKIDRDMLEKMKTRAFSESARTVFSEISDSIRGIDQEKLSSCFPSNLWEELSCDLYVVFWTLDIGDIYVPEGAYDRFEQTAKQQIKQLEQEIHAAGNGSAAKAKSKEKDRLRSSLDKMSEERSRQREHVNRVMSCLKDMKDKFFPNELVRKDVIGNFLQYCIFPRLLFSQPDAIFCAKFISLLHSLLLPNFSTVHCLDRVN